METYPNVIFPDKIENSTRKALQKENEIIHDHLFNLLENEFNYRMNGVKTEVQETQEDVNIAATKEPIYINNSKQTSVLIIDLNKNIGKKFKPKPNNIQERVQPKLKSREERKTFDNNLNALKDTGFKVVKVVRNNVQYQEVILPAMIQINGKLFELVTIAGSQFNDKVTQDTSSASSGSYAEYIAVPEMGSTGATAIGFVFPNLKETKEVQEIIKEANPQDESTGGFNAGGNTPL